MENNKGPNTEPWGTPLVTETMREVHNPDTTACCLPDRYDLKSITAES